MKYAKLTEENQIVFPTESDYTDGVLSGDWKEYVESPKPEETAIHKYSPVYSLVAEEFGGEYRIVQAWSPWIKEPVGRVAKLSGNQLVFPSQNETMADGTLICNFDRLPNSRKLECGYYLVIEAEYPNNGKVYRETGVLVEDLDFGHKVKVILEEVIPEPPTERDIIVESLRQKYREVVAQICTIAGMPIVTKFNDAETVVGIVKSAPVEVQGQLFMLSMMLKQIIDELRRPSMDGDAAWERI